MRKSAVQISLWDIYDGVSEAIEQHKPQLIRLLEEHIDFDRLIPVGFKLAFYRYMGRKHIYHLESFIRALVIQKVLRIPKDTLLISVLRLSAELRDFCGFNKVPDASQFTRFRENYHSHLAQMFEHLVDLTEPICREIDAKKADYFIYDTTGIELPVAGKPFTFLGKSGGKNRSTRFKWVCPASVQKGSSRICVCDHPCTDSSYGKCVYNYSARRRSPCRCPA